MNLERRLPWETPQDTHKIRVLGSMLATINGQPVPREVAEYIEGWSDVFSARVPRAQEAFRAGDEELAHFLVDDRSPYL